MTTALAVAPASFVVGFDGHPVRCFNFDNRPWLVARDLRKPLGVTQQRVQQAVEELPPEDKRQVKLVSSKTGQVAIAVSESGAYQLVMQSRSPVGRRMQKWIADLSVSYSRGEHSPAINTEALQRIASLESSHAELRAQLATVISMRQALPAPAAKPATVEENLARFIGECIRPCPGGEVAVRDLYQVYVAWCKRNRIKPSTNSWFGRGLSAAGVAATRVGGGNSNRTRTRIDITVLAAI